MNNLKPNVFEEKMQVQLFTATWCSDSQAFLESKKGIRFVEQMQEARSINISSFRIYSNEKAFYMLSKLNQAYLFHPNLSNLIQVPCKVPCVYVSFRNQIQILNPKRDNFEILIEWNKIIVRQFLLQIQMDVFVAKDLFDILVDYMILFYS